jgi:hypothetical protein
MSLIEEAEGFVDRIYPNESLASLLKDVIEKQLSGQQPLRDYYSVVDLVNPIQTYHSEKNPTMVKPPELARRLALGKQLQSYANVWFRALPDFAVEEGVLDGVWVDVPGVRGAIDYRLGESIIEFKTKGVCPQNTGEIISLYPQDLEQLAFYSVIHPSKPKINYLVFMENSSPYSLKAFKVEIKEAGTIKSILKNRISLLTEAIRNDDPSGLGRCRYYASGCQFGQNKTCGCSDLTPINIDPLTRSVDVSFGADFTKKLEGARDSSRISQPLCLTTFNIMVPRKHYMEAVLGRESVYREAASQESYKACLWISVRNLAKQLQIELTPSERRYVVEEQLEPRAWIGFRWIKLRSSSHPEGEIVPYLIKVRPSDRIDRVPPSYHLSELGIVCSVYGHDKGLIFDIYPKLNKLVQVFQVTYRDINKLLTMVKKTIDDVEKAEKEKDLLALPPCPDYMNDRRTCPLMKECNAKKGFGCSN